MTPKQALAIVLEQHRELRSLITECEAVADALDSDLISPGQLLIEVARLRAALGEHHVFEEAVLRPLLRMADSTSELKITALIFDHAGEHLDLHGGLVGVTGQLRETLARLRAHLTAEERYFLTARSLVDQPAMHGN